jgi:hypothetical protein
MEMGWAVWPAATHDSKNVDLLFKYSFCMNQSVEGTWREIEVPNKVDEPDELERK